MKKQIIYFLSVTFAAAFLFFHSCRKDKAPVSKDKLYCDSINIKYSANIKPIINKYCVSSGCHNAGASASQGDFTSYPDLKAKADNGSLRSRVINGSPTWMPYSPIGPLPDSIRKKFNCWIIEGSQNN